MQVFWFRPRYMSCMKVEKLVQYCRFYTRFLVLMGMFLSIPFSSYVFADEVDYSMSDVLVGGVSSYVAGATENAVNKTTHQVNLANNQNKNQRGEIVDALQLLHVGFSGYYSETSLGTSELSIMQQDDSDVLPEVIGEALVYPNPFRIQTGVARLGYRLSKDMDIQIQVYDMMANMILKRTFYMGATGAQKGYNKLWIDNEVFEGERLSSGVYFYLIIHEGKVLARGKMAIKP